MSRPSRIRNRTLHLVLFLDVRTKADIVAISVRVSVGGASLAFLHHSTKYKCHYLS